MESILEIIVEIEMVMRRCLLKWNKHASGVYEAIQRPLYERMAAVGRGNRKDTVMRDDRTGCEVTWVTSEPSGNKGRVQRGLLWKRRLKRPHINQSITVRQQFGKEYVFINLPVSMPKLAITVEPTSKALRKRFRTQVRQEHIDARKKKA